MKPKAGEMIGTVRITVPQAEMDRIVNLGLREAGYFYAYAESPLPPKVDIVRLVVTDLGNGEGTQSFFEIEITAAENPPIGKEKSDEPGGS